ncbi:hypothetical protein P3S68_020312 [Capsicum galapagoense]
MASYNYYPYPNNNISYDVSRIEKFKALVDKSSCLRRYIMMLMVLLVMGIIVVSVVLWITYRKEEKPQFQVMALQVPTGIEITNTTILGNWQINGTMKNPNNGLELKFMYGKISISYDMNRLAEYEMEAFILKVKSSISLFYNMTTLPDIVLAKGILSDVERTRNSDGVLKFMVQLNLTYYCEDPGISTKREKIRIYCNDVKVRFGHGPKDRGELIDAEKINCLGSMT